MSLDYEFTGIRLIDSSLTSVDWHLTANLIAKKKNGKSKEESEHDANISYQRLYFWLDINLPQIIMVDAMDDDDLYLSTLSSNVTMFCPGVPTDDLIVQLLHSKLSTLAGSNLLLGEITLKGSDTSISYTYDSSEEGYDLPLETKDYFGEKGIVRDTNAWWTRDDGFCSEIIHILPEIEGVTLDTNNASESVTPDAKKYFEHVIDPMVEFDRVIVSEIGSHIGIMHDPAKIVQIEKWKPKTI